ATPPPPPPISGGSHPWIIALCKFTDLSTEPSAYTPSYFQGMFGGTGSSAYDFTDWWSQISYNAINVSGTNATTVWHSLGMTRYEWAGLSRYDKIKTCGDAAATDANIGDDYSQYYGIVAIFNDDSPARTATTTLSHGGTQLNASDTTFNVANGSSFPAAPFPVTINDGTANNGEELHVTSKGSGNDWTVQRGYEGSTAVAHNDGATISLIDGGDLGAADVGTHGITLNGKNYNLGLVVLPPQTNMGGASHETGHGFGYSHSRALSTPTQDYQDCYDMMSFDVCRNYTSPLYTFTGTYGAAGLLGDPTPAAAGPGLNAVELNVQNFMPGGRTSTFSPGSCSQTTRDLTALNYPGGSGDMEVRIPTPNALTIPEPTPPGGNTSSNYYTVELRDKSIWDQGIPANAVLIHIRAANAYSYWVDKFGGSFIGTQGALLLSNEFVDPNNAVVTVNRMNAGAHTATVAIAAGAAGCKIAADLTYSGDTSGDYNDAVSLAADLTVRGSSVPIPSAPVTLSLGSQSCPATTNSSGHASCSITINQVPGTYTATASYAGDSAYNSASSTATNNFTINKEESQVVYNGATTSHYHDSVTASATLTDPVGGAPIAGKLITFTLNGVDTCSDTTNGSGNASCSIKPTQAAGTYTLATNFAGDAYYLSANSTTSFVVTQEETTTTYTGPTVILASAGAVTLKAQLQEDGANDNDSDSGSTGPPNPAGQTVKLSLGSQFCTGIVDASGNVQCDINPVTVPLGPEPIKAEFFGDAYYQPSSDTGKTAIVFAFPSRGAFVLGDGTVAGAGPLTTVTWWSHSWWSIDSVSAGPAPASFKGFAGSVTTRPTTSPANVCGTTFKTLPGNSTPPTDDIPSYMGVLVTSSVTKSGNQINGNWAKIVVVKTDLGYSPNAGHPGTGTIVATFCP
ncbi:MAG: Ig-like domain-containing protein, partial [Gaiellaceae bacterium]